MQDRDVLSCSKVDVRFRVLEIKLQFEDQLVSMCRIVEKNGVISGSLSIEVRSQEGTVRPDRVTVRFLYEAYRLMGSYELKGDVSKIFNAY